MKKISFILLFLVSLLSQAQDWPIRGKAAWPNELKNLDDTCEVIPLGVDFGLCAMPLGVGLSDSGCVFISGCSWIGSNGTDYSNSFFNSLGECNAACLQGAIDCIDSNLIDLLAFCPQVIDPVCGCDSITYENSCVATSYHGVSSFYPGECVTSKLQNMATAQILVYPNPSNGVFSLKALQLATILRFYNVYGQLVFSTEVQTTEMKINLEKLPKGCYLLTIDHKMSQKILIE